MKLIVGYNQNGLRKERSLNCSGELNNEHLIEFLPEKNYVVLDRALDGDAPKQFIKAWHFDEGSTVRKAHRKSWPAYIAKTAEKWYPHESVIEYMINRIGQVLQLRMNEVKLVRANGQIRFLSRFFLNLREQRLVHGAEICGQHLGDYELAEQIANNKDTARSLFTFEFIKSAIKEVYPDHYESLVLELVRMITFDALVGNNDRHFYNWGVIDTIRKTNKKPLFAPLYDSARGFYWNKNEQAVVKDLYEKDHNGKKLVNYIERSYPRMSLEDNKKANHFELVHFLKERDANYAKLIFDLASEERETEVLRMVQKEFGALFSKERIALITFILQTRFKKIRH